MPNHPVAFGGDPLAPAGVPPLAVPFSAPLHATSAAYVLQAPEQIPAAARPITGRTVHAAIDKLAAGSQTTTTTTSQPAADHITGGDVLVAGATFFGTVLLVIATGIVAWKQGRISLVDRQERRAERAERRAERERRARQDAWRAEYDEIRQLLKHGDDLVYGIREHGPHTSRELEQLGARGFAMEALQLANRGLTALHGPLDKLSGLAQELAHAGVPDSAEITAAWQASRRVTVPLRITPLAVERRAIHQYRLAESLRAEIQLTRDNLRTEWGSSN